MKQVRVALVGVGNVGRAFLELMVRRAGCLPTTTAWNSS